MNERGEKTIRRPRLQKIFGREDPEADLSLDIKDEDARTRRASEFLNWLDSALCDIENHVCFVDYIVFQDAKIENPYFYLVSPTIETGRRYREAVERLVKGTGAQKDCYSVAYHPEFVGISRSASAPDRFAVIPVTRDIPGPTNPIHPQGVQSWRTGSYPLRPETDNRWPPTNKDELVEICGVHPLTECLNEFQKILDETRQHLCDSSGNPVTFVFCMPFLVPRRDESSVAGSDLPFSEIAAELFLGVSYESSAKEATEAVLGFVRSIALKTYRVAGMRKAGRAGKAEGVEKGLRHAIETFAHQIKSVANAMNTTWLVRIESWEKIRRANPDKADRIEGARVLPAPQLFQAIRDTLILWSQTRRLTDLYPVSQNPRQNPEQTTPVAAWPDKFTDIVDRAWSLASSARFALGNINRNFEANSIELFQVWDQAALMKKLSVEGIDTPLSITGVQAETWICDATRLLAAIFDESLEHGMPNEVPNILIDWNASSKIVSATISNAIGRPREDMDSRIKPAMTGKQVLELLSEQLNAQPPLILPTTGNIYAVKIEIPLPSALVP